MPPKEVPTNVEQEVLDAVKQYWPDYPITLHMLKKPTREFVLKFYSDCIADIKQKISFVADGDPLPDLSNSSKEQAIYAFLCKIPSFTNAGFKLGDLYLFNPLRTTTFMKLIMHFIFFTDSYMDKTLLITRKVLEEKKLTEILESENDELKETKREKITLLGRMLHETEELTKKSKIINSEYDEVMISKTQLDNKRKDDYLELDKLYADFKQNEDILQQYEAEEQQLRDEITSEEEYEKLKMIRESLEKEAESLETKDFSNGLQECENSIVHLQTCLNELKKLTISEDVLNLHAYRKQHKNTFDNYKRLMDTHKDNKQQLKFLLIKLNEEKHTLIENRKMINEKFHQISEKNTLVKKQIEEDRLVKFEDNEVKLKQRFSLIKSREDDIEKLKAGISSQYEEMNSMVHKTARTIMKKVEEFNAAVEELLD